MFGLGLELVSSLGQVTFGIFFSKGRCAMAQWHNGQSKSGYLQAIKVHSLQLHVGKCAGSIKHSLPVTSAKAGPSSPQNDSDWPCDDSNKRQITENTGQRRNDMLSSVAV